MLPRLSFNLGQLRSRLNAAYQSDWSALVYMRSDDMLLLVAISPDQLVLERIADDPALRYMIRARRAAEVSDLHLPRSALPAREQLTALGNSIRAGRAADPRARTRAAPPAASFADRTAWPAACPTLGGPAPR